MTAMPRRARLTPDEKAAALELQAEVGTAEAARRLGIPEGTMASWVARAGQTIPATPAQAAARASIVATKLVTTADRKADLAARLIEDAEQVRRQLFAPTVERKVVTVSGGRHGESRVEIVDVQLPQPTFADQRNIMLTLSGLLDKALLLLGEATERVEKVTIDTTPRTPEVEQELAKVLALVRPA